MITPQYLKKGDTIGIVAPSRAIEHETLKYSIEVIEKKGFNVKIGNSIGEWKDQFAGSDQLRANDIINMFADESVKAIWCARGGYGSVRTLQYVDLNIVKINPKWFIGYSDITVFHSAFNRLGMETIHATMPVNITEVSDIENYNSIFELLIGSKIKYNIQQHKLNIIGEAEGQLVGGNLSVLYSLRGTPADISFDDKILFIEDLDEYLYHIDRIMMNLTYGRLLKNIKGVIVGGMTDMKDNTIPYGKNAEEIVYDHLKDLGIPVCFGFDAGHTPKNIALPMGKIVKLNINKKFGLLSFEQ